MVTLSDCIQNEEGNYTGMIWTRDVKEFIQELKKRNTITHQITINDVIELAGEKLISRDALHESKDNNNVKEVSK